MAAHSRIWRLVLVGLLLVVAGAGWSAQAAPPAGPAGAPTPNPGVDRYEADNDVAAAWNIAANEVQTHTIYPAADEDWVRFAPPEFDTSYTLTVQNGTLPLAVEVWVKREPQTDLRLTQRWRMPAGSSQSLVLTPDSGTDYYKVRVIAQQRTELGSYDIAITDEQSELPGSIDLLPTPFATLTLPPTPQRPPSPTPTTCVDDVAFVADVTVPDGTVVAPAQRVDKVWRLRNSGGCRWGAGYAMAYVSGSQMSGPPLVSLPDSPPGATVDVGVTLYAPSSPGTYTGYWQLRNAFGALFGRPFLVQIVVPAPPTPTPLPTPQAAIAFSADRTDIQPGECATLRWDVENVSAVYLEGEGVVGHGSRSVCPGVTTSYTLRVVRLDGGSEDRRVTINVAAPAGVPRPSKTAPPDGSAFDRYPRTADFQWSAVSYPGGVSYVIEIQWASPAGEDWQVWQLVEGLPEPAYHMDNFVGAYNLGRWRVWAVSNATGQLGPKTGWWTFHFTQ